ncbi:MAG: FHA domain-containing protein [Deltaproteobacteria bacterium]|nr:FHA domain-containing protein [Deltaproteobacteria bacterium]
MSGPERTVMFQLPSMLAGKLACVAGTLAGRSWELSAGTFVIGRNDSCDLALTAEPGVSKVHCKLVAEGEHYLLVDCESRNGTIVNGAPVQRVKMRDGDEIRICGCVLRFAQTGGDTQVRVRNADAPIIGDEGEAAPAVAMARAPEPPMILPTDALAVVEPSESPAPPPPPAPRRSRGRTLVAWYASGLAGSLLFGGTASAVIFSGTRVDEQVAVRPDLPGAADKPADHPSDKPADPAADADKPATDKPATDTPTDAPTDQAAAADKPAAAVPGAADGAAPAVPALDPLAVKPVAEADKPPVDEDAPDKPVEAAPAPPPAPPRDEERRRPRPRREESAAEPASEPTEGTAKLFAATVEGGKGETLKTRGGKVKSVEAADGDAVERGKVLITFDAGGNEDDLSTLQERIASLEGIDDDEARRQLRDARQRLEALQAASKSVPVVAGMSGKLSGFAVAVGDLLKPNQVVGHVSEAGAAKRVRVTVDRATRVKRGDSATLVLRGGSEATGTVSSTKGRTVVIDTGDTPAENVESVRF